MREILFRAKRHDENHNDWIYGHLHIIDTCGNGYTGKAIQQQFGAARPYSVRVKDETVCQYTGLKDKNGEKIFEGDLCKTDDGEIGEIKFVIEHCAYLGYTHNPCQYHRLESDGTLTRTEVIGNIHDNPELLQEE